jgi:hypothetical protein
MLRKDTQSYGAGRRIAGWIADRSPAADAGGTQRKQPLPSMEAAVFQMDT